MMVCIVMVVLLGSECKTEGVSRPASLADERPDELLLLPAVGSSVVNASGGDAGRGPAMADTALRALQCEPYKQQVNLSYTYEYIRGNLWCASASAHHQDTVCLFRHMV